MRFQLCLTFEKKFKSLNFQNLRNVLLELLQHDIRTDIYFYYFQDRVKKF